jgi:predicted RNA methylase
VVLEQYKTSAHLAASMLFTVHHRGELEGRVIADLGCGTGVLAIGAAVMGAR